MKRVIEIKDLTVTFSQNKELINAVKKSNFFINEGECFSIVGESGSGKSVTAMSMMRLLKENSRTEISGFIKFDNKNIDLIMNLQGDEPLMNIEDIRNLNDQMIKNKSQLGTLAS